MLYNALIEPYFDYACPAWYANLTEEKTKNKIQIMQNKYVRFCLRLDKMHQISFPEFRSITWLPTNKIVHQCINAVAFKLVIWNCPFYVNEIFEFALHCSCRIDTRNNFARLKHTFHSINMGQKTSSCNLSRSIFRGEFMYPGRRKINQTQQFWEICF